MSTRSPDPILRATSRAANRPARLRHFAVCGDTAAVALVAHYGNFAVEAAKIVDQCGQVVAHSVSSEFMLSVQMLGDCDAM